MSPTPTQSPQGRQRPGTHAHVHAHVHTQQARRTKKSHSGTPLPCTLREEMRPGRRSAYPHAGLHGAASSPASGAGGLLRGGNPEEVRCPWGWCPWVAPAPSISPTSGGQASSSRKAPSCNLRAEVNRGQPERRRLGVLGASTGTRERRRLGFGAESKSTGFGAESGSGMRCSFGKS